MLELEILEICPVLRTFDDSKARAFYLDWLGFVVEFEHRFHPEAPLYMSIVRDGLTLHLSEHHGDATPGSTTFVRMTGLADFHEEIMAKSYSNNRPGLEKAPWGLEMEVIDPFGNRIRFNERVDNQS